jgi:CheY-like chemotaxis protein
MAWDASVPLEFVRLVQDALKHLYDPARLIQHPLVALLSTELPGLGNPGQELRVYLLDAIESLEPAPRAPSSEKERRPYIVLVDRYIGGLSIEEIGERLHLGARQVRREHRIGVRALAAYLWHRCNQQVCDAGVRKSPALDSLQRELDILGVQLEDTHMIELLQAVERPIRALAHGHNCGIVFAPAPQDLFCLCDRTLAKQALLSCLNSLVAQHPRYIEVAAVALHGAPVVLMKVSPALSADLLPALDRELETCRALVASQGGHVRIVAGESGSCAGVAMLFRSAKGQHVLVVDDNERMLQLYTRYLSRGHYQVTTAASAAEAQTFLQRNTPDIVVLDVLMRGMDGWELLQKLRASPRLKHVPVVVCSILEEPSLALVLGAQAYLKKPIVPEDLLATLHQLLGGSNQGEQNPTVP